MERLPHELLLNILSFVGKEKVRRTIHAGGMQQQVPGFAIFDAGISVYTPQIEKCLIHHQAANLDSWG